MSAPARRGTIGPMRAATARLLLDRFVRCPDGNDGLPHRQPRECRHSPVQWNRNFS